MDDFTTLLVLHIFTFDSKTSQSALCARAAEEGSMLEAAIDRRLGTDLRRRRWRAM